MRLLHPQLNRTSFAIFHLCLKQSFEVVKVRVVALSSFFSERGELRSNCGQPQRLAALSDACGLKAHACTACRLWEKSWSYSIMVGSGRSYADRAPISIASPIVCCN